MKHSRIYGIAMIIGTLGATATMIFHPTGHDLLGQPEETARRNEMITIATHALAIASFPLLFGGLSGLSRYLDLERPLVSATLIAYGIGGICGIMAAIINGLAGPVLTRRINEADEATQKLLHLVLMNNGLMNQAFTKVFVVFTALAFIGWSICLLKKSKFMQVTAVIGFIIGCLSLFGILSGQLRLNVHGFGLIIFGQSLWTILVGVFMFRLAEKTDDPGR